jgi:hypothetical protein
VRGTVSRASSLRRRLSKRAMIQIQAASYLFFDVSSAARSSSDNRASMSSSSTPLTRLIENALSSPESHCRRNSSSVLDRPGRFTAFFGWPAFFAGLAFLAALRLPFACGALVSGVSMV